MSSSEPDVVNSSEANSEHGWHNTTPGAWVVVFVIIAAFGLGGAALVIWNFVLFWIAVGIAVVGVGLGAAIGIMDQVEEYPMGAAVRTDQ